MGKIKNFLRNLFKINEEAYIDEVSNKILYMIKRQDELFQ